MLLTARYRVCCKRKHLNRPRSISLLSFSLRGCRVKTGTRFLIISTAQSWVYPSFSSSSHGRIGWHPTASLLSLAGTHNYLAGIYNYFFTIWTMTMVPHGLPLRGWYCTICFLFFVCAAKIDVPLGLHGTWIMPSLAPTMRIAWELSSGCVLVCFLFFVFVRINMPWVFLTLPACF